MILRVIAIVLTIGIAGFLTLGVTVVGGTALVTAFAGGILIIGAAAVILRGGIIGAPVGIACAALAILVAVLALFGTLGIGLWNRDDNAKRFLDAYMRARMPSVFDKTGRWLGAYPAGAFADYDRDPSLPGQMSIASRQAPPPAFTTCALYLEDRSFKNWLIAALGVDFTGIMRAAVTLHGGGSGLIQMTSREMRRLSPSRDEPFISRWRRKFLEWSDSPALAAIVMAPDRDPIDFVASNLHLVVGYKPNRLGELPAGLEFASRMIFGVPPEQLSEAQQLVLSAAIWLPVVIAPDTDRDGIAAVDGRWKKLLVRARRCAPLVAVDIGRSVDSVTAEINALASPRIKTDAIANEQAQDPVQRFKIAAHPARRLTHAVGIAGLETINNELTNAVGSKWRGQVNAVELGLDVDRQAALAADIDAAVNTIEARHRDRLLLRLSGSDEGPDRAQVLAVIADANGVIRGFFESGAAGALDQTRQGGSVDKILGAAILGHYDHPDTGYCNKAVTGLHNAGGHEGVVNCGQAGAYLAARDVFARSVSLALLNRLSKLPPAEIDNVVRTLGFDMPAGTPPATAVAAGYVEGTPRKFLRMMIAIARALAGRGGDAPAPRLIDQLELATGLQGNAAPFANALPWSDIKQIFVPSVPYMRDVLGAPLQRGTLASIGYLHQTRNPQIRWHIAKTGTSTLLSGLTRDAMIAGAFETNEGEVFAYFVLVGAPQPRQPLGRLNGAHVAPIAAAIVTNFLKRSAHYASR